MKFFCNKVRSGKFVGASGKKIKDVVNIGIGGSFLGPQMVVEALKDYHDGPNIHYVSNVDGTDLQHVLAKLNPEETLFLIASKTFTTEETMTNARKAREWIYKQFGSLHVIKNHFVAMSTNHEKVKEFGIAEENRFEFWDFVGGRFSTWSAIGLSIALSVGYNRFEDFLRGGESMDQHFLNNSFERNLPVILALITLWYIEFWNYNNYVNLPYSQLLKNFPLHLQQLDMESNGKYINFTGEKVDYTTAPITWGMVGTNGQHSFYQLLHQGTIPSIIDFIGVLKPNHNYSDHHDKLIANLIAQSESLAFGSTSEEVKKIIITENTNSVELKKLIPHRTFLGNRPSCTLLLNRITPYSIGQLLALYEHRTMVLGYIWGINSFDQWGVELGKINAKNILKKIKSKQNNKDKRINSSSQELINLYLDR